jgi:hypothetical protein
LIAPAQAQSAEADTSASDSTAADSTEKPTVTFGGAIRLNYSWQDYNPPRQDRHGDFGFELFRADVNGEYGNIFLSVQYRWYEFFEAIHHGFFGYHINPEMDVEIGINQVPFGILPAASHSFWFGATYYMGFEDDYDAGIKLHYAKGPWNMHGAFYKNAEYVDASRTGRYSFDLVTADSQANSEINQFNFRGAYRWEPAAGVSVDLGGSLEFGQIYNDITRDKGDRYAYAGHADMRFGHWNLQLQWIEYSFFPANPPGIDRSTVQLAAFAFPFLMASRGSAGTLNLARDIPLEWRVLDGIRCYGDLSKIFPRGGDTQSSTQIVTGCLLMKERLYTYVDVITGQNMWFAGGAGIGLNDPTAREWNSRLNINMGFYF